VTDRADLPIKRMRELIGRSKRLAMDHDSILQEYAALKEEFKKSREQKLKDK